MGVRISITKHEVLRNFSTWVSDELTVKILDVAAPLMNCIIRGTEMCYIGPISLVTVFGKESTPLE